MKTFSILIAIALLTACNKDDDSGPMENLAPDLTLKIVGSYTGQYVADVGNGAILTADEAKVVVSKTSDEAVEFEITVIPGLDPSVLPVQMLTDSTFDIPEYMAEDGTIKGSGSLMGGSTLQFQILEQDTLEGNYVGERD